MPAPKTSLIAIDVSMVLLIRTCMTNLNKYTNKSADLIESALLVRGMIHNVWPHLSRFCLIEKIWKKYLIRVNICLEVYRGVCPSSQNCGAFVLRGFCPRTIKGVQQKVRYVVRKLKLRSYHVMYILHVWIYKQIHITRGVSMPSRMVCPAVNNPIFLNSPILYKQSCTGRHGCFNFCNNGIKHRSTP